MDKFTRDQLDGFVVGGQITPAGREAGLSDDDLAGGQLTAAATDRWLTNDGTVTVEDAPSVAEAVLIGEPSVDMTKADLLTMAAQRGVEVDASMTKAQIVDAIAPEAASD